MKFGFLALILILPGLILGAALTIELENRIWIDSPVVTLDQIVTHYAGSDSLYRQIRCITVCNLPYRERFRNLYEADIRKLVPEQHRRDIVIDGAFCVVRWKKQTLDQNRVYKAAREYISQSYPDADSLKIEMGELPQMDTPPDGYSIRVEFPDGIRKMGNVRMVGTILHDSTELSRFTFPVYIGVFREGYRLTAIKRRGEGFYKGDFVRVDLNIAEEGNAITDSLELHTRIASRYIPAGTILTRSNTSPIPDIHRGDRVTVLVNSGTIRLETVAIAKDTSYLGESILCEDPSTGRRYLAMTSGKRQAIINIGE